MAVVHWSGNRRACAGSGFSLIEVLVALAIFAVLASTIVFQSGAYGLQLFRLEEKTLALWVAQNALDALRLDFPQERAAGSSRKVEMGERTWIVHEKISDTSRKGFHRIDVTVAREGETDALVSLSGFVARP
ncbi:MAG: type II secretion system minor pseudopilin GspI [Pseudomonadales bacterium]|jgi:general secretion pathway protein I|nr:type II secretion system minor pseudopilin GspI [Pseudomonadales bacterium]MBP6227787.1 type II secretion system minor pseudopilin GspI [Pseudomonadales bacterium]